MGLWDHSCISVNCRRHRRHLNPVHYYPRQCLDFSKSSICDVPWCIVKLYPRYSDILPKMLSCWRHLCTIPWGPYQVATKAGDNTRLRSGKGWAPILCRPEGGPSNLIFDDTNKQSAKKTLNLETEFWRWNDPSQICISQKERQKSKKQIWCKERLLS